MKASEPWHSDSYSSFVLAESVSKFSVQGIYLAGMMDFDETDIVISLSGNGNDAEVGFPFKRTQMGYAYDCVWLI